MASLFSLSAKRRLLPWLIVTVCPRVGPETKQRKRGVIMIDYSDFRTKRLALNHGPGCMPVLGFRTLIPDAAATVSATRDALEAGFRHFDCAERYRNEREVGQALQAGRAAGKTRAQVLLAWAVQRGTALLTTPRTGRAHARISTSRPSRRRTRKNQSHSDQTKVQRSGEDRKPRGSFQKGVEYARRTNTRSSESTPEGVGSR